ncbi:hypothetical protein I2494_06520 [Budviciaceae bacterium BWR-B9]|uniref:Uncharacterized protein n=1 Tax=Limnobaculum allomyrinae TaxID=2791986 RepID=A0ABS1INZ8_9GAMM|nr:MULTISPECIES: hypothetical protein [Limnobaculum]MBK5143374.1 hypothetical protein [Limnobaculum allomyrinae]MBV7691262.1 hypothetical protein [Limnobaculum sp. M2-1]
MTANISAVSSTEDLTTAQWDTETNTLIFHLARQQGEKGDKGDKGDTGETGIAGETGPKGDSAYQTWLNAGHTGSENDFVNWVADIQLREELVAYDGAKLIGRCPSIEVLRTIIPTYHGQKIEVANYYADSVGGGGCFYYDADDRHSLDNGGNIIVSNGARWKSLKNAFVPEDFGARGRDVETDTSALQRLFDAKVKIAPVTGHYHLRNLNRPVGDFKSWMTYNYILKIDGFSGEADFSQAIFTLPEGVSRITAIVVLNSSGKLHFPAIQGNMQKTIMPSLYIDDCAVRIGAGCKSLTIAIDGIDHYPGHGIIVRHYEQDGVSSLKEDIPNNITIIAKGVRHCWQSGIVPVHGDSIRIIDFDVQYSGSIENMNAKAATIGHNIHTEPVAEPSGENNLLRNVWILNGNGLNARMHGLMCHTAIDNFVIEGCNFQYNQMDGACFEAATHNIRSCNNTYSNNGYRGVTFSCGSLTAAGFPLLKHDAKFDDTFEFNGNEGLVDMSGSHGLIISGTFGRNGGNGITVQENGEQQIVNAIIYDNGRNATVQQYGIACGKTSLSNIQTYNSDPTVYKQIPFLFRKNCKARNITTDSSTIDYVLHDSHQTYLPDNDSSLRLVGDSSRIVGRRCYINNRGDGLWYMSDVYDAIHIGFTSSATMMFPGPSLNNLMVTFTLTITSGIGYVKVRSGTVNDTNQYVVQSGNTYQLTYISPTNLQVIKI